MAARKTALLELDGETWGDRVHRAYRRARERYGSQRDPKTRKAAFSYQVVAAKMQAVGIPMTDQALFRLEQLEKPPERMRQRQVAYFALIAYGYDPEDFGLNADNVSLSGYDLPKIIRAIRP